jgi:hypothetical protein
MAISQEQEIKVEGGRLAQQTIASSWMLMIFGKNTQAKARG